MFLHRKQNVLNFSLIRLLCNDLIQPPILTMTARFGTKALPKKIQSAQNKCVRFC